MYVQNCIYLLSDVDGGSLPFLVSLMFTACVLCGDPARQAHQYLRVCVLLADLDIIFIIIIVIIIIYFSCFLFFSSLLAPSPYLDDVRMCWCDGKRCGDSCFWNEPLFLFRR